MSGIVVGIDPSLTSTGVVVIHDGTPTTLCSVGRKLHEMASYGQRADRMTFTLSKVLALTPRDADLIVIEGMNYGGAGKYTDPDVFGLWWHVMTHLHARGGPIAVIPPQSLKVWATGKAAEKVDGVMRRTDKSDMIAAARQQFPDSTIRNGDVADALHCASAGAAWLGHPLPFRLKLRHHNQLHRLTWPVPQQQKAIAR